MPTNRLNAIFSLPGAFGSRDCHRLSSLASTPNRYATQIDNSTDAGVIDASKVILTLYVISNRRGLAHRLAGGCDGERKTTWLSRRWQLDSRSPMPSPVLLVAKG